MVILSSCGFDGEKLKIQKPENTKYVKRQKVFVVRDFPKGFEQFSAQTNRIENESLISVCSDEDLFERIYVASDLEDDSSEPSEVVDVSMSLEQMIEYDHEETLELGANSLKLFDDSEFLDQLETPKLEITDLLHDVFEDVAHTHQADWAKTYFPRRTVFAVRSFPPRCGRDAKHLSIDNGSSLNNGLGCNKYSVENEPFDDDDYTEPFEFEVGDQFSHEDSPSLVEFCTESFPKICAPQRRVSAIRFFPPGCGRNALLYPSKEDSEKALDYSKNKATCHEECSTKQAPGKKAIKNDFPRASYSNIESERIDTMKNRVKPTHSRNLYQSKIKSQPVSGRKYADVEDSSKKPKKELAKTKLSSVSTNIVLALMAAPRCSSGKGKTAFKTQLK